MTITIDDLRGRFPNPTSTPGPGSYCVGGAFCMFVAERLDRPDLAVLFPDAYLLAEAIASYRPVLRGRAMELARRIIVCNDRGHTEQAWGIIESIL